jgi:hypothetical protein
MLATMARRPTLKGQPMTLGNMLDYGLELIIGCEECSNTSVADVATLVERYGRHFPVFDIGELGRCTRCRSYARADVRVSGYKRPVTR